MVKEIDINAVLSEFPEFELSYETMVHNKVHDANIMLAIPEGNKYFAWFTVYNNENVCFLLDSSKKIYKSFLPVLMIFLQLHRELFFMEQYLSIIM